MIRYLETEEKQKSMELWKEAFSEDSLSFCDYYEKEKMADNRVLVREENGAIVSMLHRNPYRIYMGGKEAVCDYIVGVATGQANRHKGYMRSLMIAALRDMQEERMPFTFLMPAREALYLPYDFRYIFDQPRWVLKYNPHIRREPCDLAAFGADLAEWQTAWLKRKYEVFTIRDEKYLKRMEKELSSENGSLRLLYDDDWFIGMQSEWGLTEREMRYLYVGENYRSEVGKKPAIMGRIVCMPEFVKPIRLSENCPREEVTVEIGVNDLFVPQNMGAWIWRINKRGSIMTQESRFIAKGKMEVFTISELTEWLFGYRIPKQVERVPYGTYIRPFQGVFLDEIV